MFFHTQFIFICIFFLLCLILSVMILFFSFFLSKSQPDVEKVSAYECGFDPYEDARIAFDIRFYLIAILFLIFDLETIYFLPWSINLSFASSSSFFYLLDFFFELIFGFFYAWIVGALDWE